MVVGSFTTEIDVLVVGAGPGGYVAAVRAAQLGKKVTLVDKAQLGGVCLHRGCIPSKALIHAAHQYEQMQQGAEMGIVAETVRLDFAQIQSWKQGIITKLTGGLSTLMKSQQIDVVQGDAFFNDLHTVTVSSGEETTRYRFNSAIVATGSRPIELPAFPFGGRILSSDDALNLAEIPQRLCIIGGGYIGVELGQTFAKMGSKVAILEGAEAILPAFEPQLTQPVVRNLERAGVELHTQATAIAAEKSEQDVVVRFRVGQEEKQWIADYVLVTVGRRPNSDDIGLGALGIKISERGYIEIDNHCRTSISHIYAIGDVVTGPALAHKASYEAKVAAENIAGHERIIDYQAIPAVVFAQPEIAVVGIDQSKAKQHGLTIIVGRAPFRSNGRAMTLNQADGFIQLIASQQTGLLLGAQIVGPGASDLIAELGLAMEMGTTLEDLALTIHAHPTLSEVIMEAAAAAIVQKR
jgi:dihydrolipoamide dehydrogenase